jgi:malonate-semialdehyde dehydrogenase (acetylating)/methylmalonate-semialdehyde dehydrogenase
MLSATLRTRARVPAARSATRALATQAASDRTLQHKWGGTTVDGGKSLNLIGGEWTAGGADKWLDINDPSSQALLSRVPETPLADMVRAVDKAEEAFDEWKDSSPLRRQAVMLKYVLVLEIARSCRSCGRPRARSCAPREMPASRA